MTAAPINDNTPFIARSIIRDLALLDTVDLRQVIAASVGLLYDKMGPVHTGKMICHIMDACRKEDAPLTLHEVANVISQKHQVPVSVLRKKFGGVKENPQDMAHIRQEAFWLARHQFRADGTNAHTLPQIGRFFGDRDHTTVLHGVRQHNARRERGEVMP